MDSYYYIQTVRLKTVIISEQLKKYWRKKENRKKQKRRLKEKVKSIESKRLVY